MTAWAAFLDRDGVLTEAQVVEGAARGPSLASDLRVLPGAREALVALKALGATLIVVTNQPDIARGCLSPLELDAMHDRLRAELPVDEIVVCPHAGTEGCRCRKPAPGMLVDSGVRHGVDMRTSWMVGDRWVDVAAGASAGVSTVLIERDYSWRATSSGSAHSELRPDYRVRTIEDAAAVITSATIPHDQTLPCNPADMPGAPRP